MKWLFMFWHYLIWECLAKQLLPPFLDCTPKYRNFRSFLVRTRRCCTSDLLPNGCECFDISKRSEFRNSMWYRPKCPKDLKDVQFFLYTRSNQHTPTLIKFNDASLNSRYFKPNKPTKFLTHGFRSHGPKKWSRHMKDELLKLGDMNVIIVNWKKGAGRKNYMQATANVRTVGAMMGQLLNVMKNKHGVDLKNIHLIGHSLGAHVSGTAAKEVRRLNNGALVGRISGLDPAGARFGKYSSNVRLDKSDALFVDVIHTDAESLIKGGFGTTYSIGHVDFWPNGGKDQPGCPKERFGFLSVFRHGKKISCDHDKALQYFSNSINDCPYPPSPKGDQRCTMGYHTNRSCKGDVYLKTTHKC